MIYGYARVSSTGQQRDGNSLEAQKEALTAAGATQVFEEAYTGTKMDRPQFTALMKKLKAGDTLKVCKLDRFARTVADGLNMIDDLLKRGVSIHILNMGMIDDTPVGKLTRTIFLGFAEFERDMIVQRTQEGKRIAKLKNPDYKEGRKRIESDADTLTSLVRQVESGKTTVTAAARQLGMSRATFNRRRKEMAKGGAVA